MSRVDCVKNDIVRERHVNKLSVTTRAEEGVLKCFGLIEDERKGTDEEDISKVEGVRGVVETREMEGWRVRSILLWEPEHKR